MYRYVMSKALKDRLTYYNGHGGWVTSESWNWLVQCHGFPRGYVYWHVLTKLASFDFYSPKLLREVYVAGYPIPVKFFDVTARS